MGTRTTWRPSLSPMAASCASWSSSSDSSSRGCDSPSRKSSSSSQSPTVFVVRRIAALCAMRYTLVAKGLAVITTHPSHSPAVSDPATTSTHLLIPGAKTPSVNLTSAAGHPVHSTCTPTLPCKFLFLTVIRNRRVTPGTNVPASIAAVRKCVHRGASTGCESRRAARSTMSSGTGAPELTRDIAAWCGLALDTASTCAYLSYLGYASRSRGLYICRRAYTAKRRFSAVTSLLSQSNFFNIASTALASSRLAPRPATSSTGFPLPALSVGFSCAPRGRCHARIAIWHINETNSLKSNWFSRLSAASSPYAGLSAFAKAIATSRLRRSVGTMSKSFASVNASARDMRDGLSLVSSKSCTSSLAA